MYNVVDCQKMSLFLFFSLILFLAFLLEHAYGEHVPAGFLLSSKVLAMYKDVFKYVMIKKMVIRILEGMCWEIEEDRVIWGVNTMVT